jgi:succinyl-diaminopimelate desuccinylase
MSFDDPVKAALLDRIDADAEELKGFLSGFLQCRSANPPGDTRSAAAFVSDYLRDRQVPHRYVAAFEHMPNVVGSFECGGPGRHLVLNGHIDVFPALDDEGWSGAIRDGKIFGRGAADMKAGTAAGVFTYAYLHAIRDRLKGKLTLTAVSDEQTGGKYGTKYLLETIPDEVTGDCCLNGEPSGLNNIRFMEKGTLRLKITARAPGGHGGYPHLSENPNKIMAQIINDVERFHGRKPVLPPAVERALCSPEGIATLEAGMGKGAAEVVRMITVNPGVIHGGLKINQIPHECVLELDMRIPIGFDRDAILEEVKEILSRYPGVAHEVIEAHSYPPSMADPEGEMMRVLQKNAQAVGGMTPVPMSSLGGSDSRYWRYRNVPAYLYGPSPVSMGRADEHVTVDEFLHIVKVHLLSAYDYLTAA